MRTRLLLAAVLALATGLVTVAEARLAGNGPQLSGLRSEMGSISAVEVVLPSGTTINLD